MSDKQDMLRLLEAAFNRWEALLNGLSEAQIAASRLPNGWSVKDLTAHVMAWQQLSFARLEASRRGGEPVFPAWLGGADPEAEDVDRVNARIYDLYREQLWPRVHEAWRNGFLKFLSLAREIPDTELVDREKYPWLNGHSLFDVLKGSYEHHHTDHFGALLAWKEQTA